MNADSFPLSTANEHDAPDSMTSTTRSPPWPELKGSLISDSLLQSQVQPSPKNFLWPELELSIGFPCRTFGRHKCWEVVGPARTISHTLYRVTKDLLDQHSEYLHEREEVPFSVMFGLYMIGRSEKDASPTLLLSCESKNPRQKAMKVLQATGIIKEYPGLLLAESSHPPTAIEDIRPLGALNALDPEFVFFSPPSLNNVCGRPIILHSMEKPNDESVLCTSISQKATIGGFVRLKTSEYEDVYCGLTVAHAFEDDLRYQTTSASIVFAFAGKKDNENDGEREGAKEKGFGHETLSSQDNVETVSSLMDQVSILSRQLPVPGEPRISQPAAEIGGHGIGNLVATSLDGEHPELDWALIEIQKPHHEPANIIQLGDKVLHVERIVPAISENADVLVITSTGVKSGVLSTSSSFLKSAYGCSFEEVFTVRVDGRIKKSDTGSWVIDPATGSLYGHMIAGCPLSHIAYLVPAYRIFKDVCRQMGGVIELPAVNKTTHLAAPESTVQSSLSSCHLPLGMNQGAEEIIKYFDIDERIFAHMAIDADFWYQAMSVNPANLKQYIKKSSPYSWHDISDKAKYEHIVKICTNGDEKTQDIWNKGLQQRGDCPNWLARWFLYRRFRLAGTSKLKRFSEVNPADLNYMAVARNSYR